MEKSKEDLAQELNNLQMEQTILEKAKILFASKLTEIIVYSLCGLILTGAIVAILTLIYSKK